jgi:hypothetical protein
MYLTARVHHSASSAVGTPVTFDAVARSPRPADQRPGGPGANGRVARVTAACSARGPDTVARLIGLIAEKGMKTFAVIDQAAEAR